MRSRTPLLVPIFVLAVAASRINAEPVTLNYSATVGPVPANPLGIIAGDTITGWFTYDTAAVDVLAPLNPNLAFYDAVLGTSFTASVNSLTFSGTNFLFNNAEVRDDLFDLAPTPHFEELFSLTMDDAQTTVSSVSGWSLGDSGVLLASSSSTQPIGPLTSDALPNTLGLAGWDLRRLRLVFDSTNGASFRIDSALTSLAEVPAPVPEPMSISLVLAGLAATWAARNRLSS